MNQLIPGIQVWSLHSFFLSRVRLRIFKIWLFSAVIFHTSDLTLNLIHVSIILKLLSVRTSTAALTFLSFARLSSWSCILKGKWGELLSSFLRRSGACRQNVLLSFLQWALSRSFRILQLNELLILHEIVAVAIKTDFRCCRIVLAYNCEGWFMLGPSHYFTFFWLVIDSNQIYIMCLIKNILILYLVLVILGHRLVLWIRRRPCLKIAVLERLVVDQNIMLKIWLWRFYGGGVRNAHIGLALRDQGQLCWAW